LRLVERLKTEFSLFRGKSFTLVISWILMDFGNESARRVKTLNVFAVSLAEVDHVFTLSVAAMFEQLL
jgi:hypothetical protein